PTQFRLSECDAALDKGVSKAGDNNADGYHFNCDTKLFRSHAARRSCCQSPFRIQRPAACRSKAGVVGGGGALRLLTEKPAWAQAAQTCLCARQTEMDTLSNSVGKLSSLDACSARLCRQARFHPVRLQQYPARLLQFG